MKKSKHNEKLFPCKVGGCMAKLRYNALFKHHKRQHQNTPWIWVWKRRALTKKPKVTCPKCLLAFGTSGSLKSHQYHKHSKLEKHQIERLDVISNDKANEVIKDGLKDDLNEVFKHNEVFNHNEVFKHSEVEYQINSWESCKKDLKANLKKLYSTMDIFTTEEHTYSSSPSVLKWIEKLFIWIPVILCL